MKPTAIKTVLLTVMLCFTSLGVTLAQDPQFAHNTELMEDGSQMVSVYKYTDHGEKLLKYKECVITYDNHHRPTSRTVRLWCSELNKWIPCRTYTYTYSLDYCVVDLKWASTFKCCHKKDERYTFSLLKARYPEYLLAKMYE